jgi:cell filamentation protein
LIPIVWRWEERDLGFRFRGGRGTRASEYYQARWPGKFYVVPGAQRKLTKARIEELMTLLAAPASPQVVANPWRDYERDWDWIVTEDGICLNWAGCLDQEEIDRRADEGVQRAMELVADLVAREEPVPLSIRLIQQIHVELMGAIYPFAGTWRTVALHRGDGPTKWPLPLSGIQPLMDVVQRDALSRSPVISEDDEGVFAYASEVMNELLAVHPFREGNGRVAFILGNLILMQNDMLPLTTYERKTDEARYLTACEAGRIHKDYRPLATLLAEWEERALEEWRRHHG